MEAEEGATHTLKKVPPTLWHAGNVDGPTRPLGAGCPEAGSSSKTRRTTMAPGNARTLA